MMEDLFLKIQWLNIPNVSFPEPKLIPNSQYADGLVQQFFSFFMELNNPLKAFICSLEIFSRKTNFALICSKSACFSTFLF